MVKEKFKTTWSDKDVEAHWDRVADIYVKENNKVKSTHDQRFQEGVKHLSIESGMKILNITSRDAEATDYILKEQPVVEVINAEISLGLINEAKRLRPSVKQIKIDSYSQLPFESDYFDRILSLETLEHVAEPLVFLTELYRVSRAGTKMVLSCPPNTSESSYRIYTFLFGGHGEGPHRFPKPKEVMEMLKLTKWKLIDHFGTVLFPVGPVFMQKWGERIIKKYNRTWISNLGIRQFYICERDK